MKIYPSIKNNEGITLIEVLASIVILTIVLTTFLTFFSQAFKYNSMNQDELMAINFASHSLTFIKNSNITEGTYDSCALKEILDLEETVSGKCYFENTTYYPEVVVTIENKSTTTPKLKKFHIKIFDSQNTLLTETFGYYK